MAKVIVEKTKEEGLNFADLNVSDIKEIPGCGVIGTVNGIHMGVGKLESGEGRSSQIYASTEEDYHSRVYVTMDKSMVAALCLSDQPRNDASQSIIALKQEGIHTAMLTGDRREIAEDIARKLGVDEVYAGLLPEDKLKIAAQLRSKYGLTAMVGDGVNDAPVLAASGIGIAMGGSGIDVSLESADIILAKDELIRIPYIYKLSKLAVKIAKQNIAVSLGVKLGLGALGFLGLVPLWFAVAAGDDGVTMLLLLNTLRLTDTSEILRRVTNFRK
jgi:Cd2+/Zn2+-exporting ATPase